MVAIIILLVMTLMNMLKLKIKSMVNIKKKDEWDKKCIENICHMGFFSSDRSIQDYANNIWELTPCEVPQPSIDKEKHYVSTSNLALAEEEK